MSKKSSEQIFKKVINFRNLLFQAEQMAGIINWFKKSLDTFKNDKVISGYSKKLRYIEPLRVQSGRTTIFHGLTEHISLQSLAAEPWACQNMWMTSQLKCFFFSCCLVIKKHTMKNNEVWPLTHIGYSISGKSPEFSVLKAAC